MKTKRTHWKKITTVMVVALSILMSLMVAGCSGSSGSSGDSGKSGSGENKYSTPVQLYVDEQNNKDASKMMDLRLAQLNGLLESEVNDMLALMKKSDSGKEYLEDLEEEAEEALEYRKEECGSDYKVTFEIEDKTELGESELSDMKDILKNAAETIAYEVDLSKDWDSDDWEAAAEDMDLTVSQTKEYYKIAERIGNSLSDAKVSEGYALTVKFTITGSKQDEPNEETIAFDVYKIDGRWVHEYFLDILKMFI